MQKKNELILYAITVFAVFLVYLVTLNPAFHANDSPETTACAVTLGVQHPPGYPLSSLLGKIFSIVPAGSEAFRVNLMSALFMSFAAGFIYLIITAASGISYTAIAIAMASAVLFSFSYITWPEALSSKGGIYSLNALLLSAVIYCLVMWDKTARKNYFWLGAFIYGVSLANHWESMAASLPALFVFFILSLREKKTGLNEILKLALGALIFMLPGVLIYLTLVIRARSGCVLNWGDPSGLQSLIDVVMRSQYTDMEKARHAEVFIAQAKRVLGHILSGLTPFGIALSAAGAVLLFKRPKKSLALMCAALVITFVLVLSLYFNLKDEMMWIMDVFMIPVFMAFVIWAGAGLASLKNKAALAAALLIGTTALAQAAVNYKRCDQARYFYAYDFGMNIIKSAPQQGALALLEGDFNVMPQMYFRHVARKGNFCPVTTLFLYVPWGVKNLKAECPDIPFYAQQGANFTQKIAALVTANYGKREIYTSVFRKALDEFYPQANRFLSPNGLLMRFSGDHEEGLKKGTALLKVLSYRNVAHDKLFMGDSTQFCVSNYASAYLEHGNAAKSLGKMKEAAYFFKRAVLLATKPTKGEALTHLGIAYAAMGSNAEAEKAYLEAIKVKPSLTEAYSNLAGVYNNTGRYDDAIAVCDRAISIKPDFPEAYNNKAVAMYYKGNKKAAVELLEQSLKFNPGNDLARKNLEAIKREIK